MCFKTGTDSAISTRENKKSHKIRSQAVPPSKLLAVKPADAESCNNTAILSPSPACRWCRHGALWLTNDGTWHRLPSCTPLPATPRHIRLVARRPTNSPHREASPGSATESFSVAFVLESSLNDFYFLVCTIKQ